MKIVLHLQYQNKRADDITVWRKVVNWDEVARRLMKTCLSMPFKCGMGNAGKILNDHI
ncbi:Fe-Mn family superoxide dismutase [Pedobacter sp. UC225_65]|uniref:Fe-Mn family superoxide dismutase n=1 Tax=Pedobacter sp. UC225_65 TaxID=3350173 RepID=UPI00366BFDBD